MTIYGGLSCDDVGLEGPLGLLLLRAFEQITLWKILAVGTSLMVLAALIMVAIVWFNRENLS
jgi:hypothetical protein